MLKAIPSHRVIIPLIVLTLFAGSQVATAQIKGQFAQDFVAGKVPTEEEIAALEKEVAAKPDDVRLVRKLAKGYFFQYFGEGRASSRPKSEKMFRRVLELRKDDSETLVYLGGLAALIYTRAKDAAEREASGQQAMELLKKALEIAPRNGAVIAVAAASYVWLDDTYKTAPIAAELVENTRKALGPIFYRMSHHGQQRLILTQGQAYVRMGQSEKARTCFEEALKINEETPEGAIARAELAKLARS